MVCRIMTLKSGSVEGALSHCLEAATDLQNATERLSELGIDAGRIPGLVDALDRGAGMTWGGAAAASLGLTGEASGADVASLLTTGRVPNRDISIPARSGGGRGAFGLIRSEDKTVSVLLASPDEQVREAALAAHRAGNAAFMATLEKLIRSRTGTDGVTSVATNGLIYGSVEHYSSSQGEPTLHSHILISRMARCVDGSFRTIDGDTLFSLTAVAESAAQAAIHDSLSKNLNVELGFRDVGSARVVEIPALRGVADQLCTAKRRVDAVLSDMARLFGPAWKEQRDAWRKYRVSQGAIAEQVEHAVDNALRTPHGAAEIRQMWGARAPGLEHALRDVSPAPSGPGVNVVEANNQTKRPNVQTVRERAWAWACEQETVRFSDLHARMTPELGIENAAIEAFRLLSHAEVERGVDKESARRAVVAMLSKKEVAKSDYHAITGKTSRFTTAPAIARAQRLTERAGSLMREKGCHLTVEMPPTATPDQIAAIGKMSAGHQLTVITGVAGAGKTYSVAPVAEAAKQNGLAVVSLARNAARALETGDGINADKSQSIAAFFKKGAPKGPTLIVLDEGGVVDRNDYDALMKLLEERPDVQLVALGDARQAQSIDRLDTWSLLEKAARENGAHAELTASRRTAAWTAEHDTIRSCEASPEMIENVLAERRIQAVTEADFAVKAAALIEKEPNSTAIVRTNAESAEISRIVQKNRGIEGVLPCAGDNRVGVGDVVRTRQNNHKTGVYNGDIWTVESIGGGYVNLRSSGGKQAFVDNDYAAEFLELGYASTLDSAQGITVDRAVVVVSEGMGNTGLYSATTRGRQPPHYLCLSSEITPQTSQKERQKAATSALKRAITTDDRAENALTFAEPPETPSPPSWGAASEVERREAKKAKRLEEIERERQIERERERVRQREVEREAELRQRYRDPSFTAPKPRAPTTSTPSRTRSRGMER